MKITPEEELRQLLESPDLYEGLSNQAKRALVEQHTTSKQVINQLRNTAEKAYKKIKERYPEDYKKRIDDLTFNKFTEDDFNESVAQEKYFKIADWLSILAGSITIIGARTGRGKTTFAFHLARVLSRYAKVGIIELEESKGQIRKRIKNTADVFLNGNISIYSPISRDVDRLEPLFRHYQNNVLIVDYVQLLNTSSLGRLASTLDQLNYISQRLLEMTLEYNVTLIAVAQFNREAGNKDNDDDDPNKLQDLAIKGCGQFEQDASLILGIGKTLAETYLKVIKNRNGRHGELFNLKINYDNGNIEITKQSPQVEKPKNYLKQGAK